MNEKTMTTKELAGFFGKSDQTIKRSAKRCGIKFENGKLKKFNKSEVELISKDLYLKVPSYVKKSIDEAFANITYPNDTGEPISNGKLELNDYELDRAFRLAMVNMNNLAQSLANKTDELDKRISKIEVQTEKRKALLPPPQIKPRDHINMIVRKYVHDTGVSHTDAWSELYKQFYYRTKTNAKVCAKNRGMGTLDYIESDGMIEILEAIAIDFFN